MSPPSAARARSVRSTSRAPVACSMPACRSPATIRRRGRAGASPSPWWPAGGAGPLLTEEGPLPVQTPYGRSKQECERMLLDSGLPVVVLRPSHVYGPGGWYAHELIPRLRQPGRFAVIGRGENMWDVVHVDDVVGALALAVERAPSGSI